MRFIAVTTPALALALISSPATAQPADTQFNEEPTTGLDTPITPLAGEYDAMAVVANPAGLRFLRGSHYGLLLHFDDDDEARSGGAGVGGYMSFGAGGGLLPPLGFGIGIEALRPARRALEPDPGDAVRLSLGGAMALGERGAFGVTYHHFFDDSTQTLSGVDTWDFGLSSRVGPHFAIGFVLRDFARPIVAGAKVQRRYELEVAVRPTGTERLELAVGGRLGETRLDVDGWLRWSWRVARGVYFKGEVVAQSLQQITTTDGGRREDTEYEGRLTAGFEFSFGRSGVTGLGTLASELDGDDVRGLSTSAYLRLSQERASPLFGDRARIAQIDLSGPMGERRLTNKVIMLRDARRDSAVKGVFVRIDGVGTGWAGARTLRAELAKIKAEGKPVMAYIVSGTTKDYYIASVADKAWVDEIGGLRLTGFAGTSLYYKGLFDKLGVDVQIERIEEFKSAPEAWTRDEPTAAAMRMRNELYDDLYDTIVSDIAEGRGLTPKRVRELIDGGPYTAGQLVDLTELVDKIVTPDDLGELVKQAMGGRSYPFAGRPNKKPERWAHPSIAVIFIEGDIVSGSSQTIPFINRRQVGGATIVRALAAARANPDIEAIVLRVDSPGGSVLPSELMAREVLKTKKVKPVICSMGDVAASGGYYVVAGCDVIFAEPTTITGSIGIFAGKPDLSALLSKIGLTWHTYKRGEAADRESYFRPYTEEERKQLKQQIRHFYDRFVGYVADGRGMTKEQVDDVGRGHVWTGRQAKQLKLVDELGGIGDAIARAKQEAGIPESLPTKLVYLPKPPSNFLNRLLNFRLIRGEAEASRVFVGLPGADKILDAIPLSLWLEPDAVQALLPFAIIWQ